MYLQVFALRVKLGVDDVVRDDGEGGEEEGKLENCLNLY